MLWFHRVPEVDSFTSWPKSPVLGNFHGPHWVWNSTWPLSPSLAPDLGNLCCKKTQHSVTGKESQRWHRELEKRKSSCEPYIFHSCANRTPWPCSWKIKGSYLLGKSATFRRNCTEWDLRNSQFHLTATLKPGDPEWIRHPSSSSAQWGCTHGGDSAGELRCNFLKQHPHISVLPCYSLCSCYYVVAFLLEYPMG